MEIVVTWTLPKNALPFTLGGAWSIIVRRRGLEKGGLLEGGLRSPLPGRGGGGEG